MNNRPYAYTSTHKNSQFYYPINRWKDIVKSGGKVKPTKGQSTIMFITMIALIFIIWFYQISLNQQPVDIKQLWIDYTGILIAVIGVIYFINRK